MDHPVQLRTKQCGEVLIVRVVLAMDRYVSRRGLDATGPPFGAVTSAWAFIPGALLGRFEGPAYAMDPDNISDDLALICAGGNAVHSFRQVGKSALGSGMLRSGSM